MDGFLANVVKYLLFFTNFAIFIIGCVVLGIGIYAIVDGAALVDLVNNSGSDITVQVYTSAAIILIVVAVFVVILTFFGCCGAIKESKCMLGTYFTLILVMFIIMIVGAVLGYSQSMEEIKGALEKSMGKFKDNSDEGDDGEKAVTKAWNTIQEDFTCCGVTFDRKNQINSWTNTSFGTPYPMGDIKVPRSCCSQFEANGTSTVDGCRKNPFEEQYEIVGCFDKFKTSFEDNKDNILIVGVVIIVVMFLNMLFAFAMCTMAN